MSRWRLLSSVDFVSVVVHTDRYVKKPSLCMAGTKHMSGAKGDQLARGRAQELRGSRGGCHGLPVPGSPYGLCGRMAKSNRTGLVYSELRSCVKVEMDVLVPSSPYGPRERKATSIEQLVYHILF